MSTTKREWRKFLDTDPFSIKGQFYQRFTTSFYASRSRKRKNTVKLSVFFALLGSVHEKAARRLLMKLTPGVNFIIILWAYFVPIELYLFFYCSLKVKRIFYLDAVTGKVSETECHLLCQTIPVGAFAFWAI
jgi:hypothetical protein